MKLDKSTLKPEDACIFCLLLVPPIWAAWSLCNQGEGTASNVVDTPEITPGFFRCSQKNNIWTFHVCFVTQRGPGHGS